MNLQFNPLSDLLVKTAGSGGGIVTVSGGSLGYASFWVDYVYLDTDERRRFAQVSHEYLIEQIQFTGSESVNPGANKLRLNFNHPVKELVWVVIPDVNAAANDSSNYSTIVNGQAVNPLVEAKLQLNGHDRFDTQAGRYFNLVQPYQYHTNIPKSPGINVYSFALKPEEHQPSGSCNFSRIDNATLNLQLQQGMGTGTANVYETTAYTRVTSSYVASGSPNRTSARYLVAGTPLEPSSTTPYLKSYGYGENLEGLGDQLAYRLNPPSQMDKSGRHRLNGYRLIMMSPCNSSQSKVQSAPNRNVWEEHIALIRGRELQCFKNHERNSNQSPVPKSQLPYWEKQLLASLHTSSGNISKLRGYPTTTESIFYYLLLETSERHPG